jgi:hypothetical protein
MVENDVSRCRKAYPVLWCYARLLGTCKRRRAIRTTCGRLDRLEGGEAGAARGESKCGVV